MLSIRPPEAGRTSLEALESKLLRSRLCRTSAWQWISYRLSHNSRSLTVQTSSRHQTQQYQAPPPVAYLAVAAAAASLLVAGSCQAAMPSDDNFQNIPGQLSGGIDEQEHRMKGPQSKQAEACIRNCIPTCIRGGEGAPGLGPLSVRKDLVRFKDGYRSRSYCLQECGFACSVKQSQQ
ncbi:hypothetical protein WJX74_005852 [Apatococcus lobatus]|uniref:Uncharacterized protein n=2 Tax=Apatococcus TaxID=904362 RepID=A0AAW1SHI7_9CHLO